MILIIIIFAMVIVIVEAMVIIVVNCFKFIKVVNLEIPFENLLLLIIKYRFFSLLKTSI